MTPEEVRKLAEEDAQTAIGIARSSTGPVAWITGNQFSPTLRAFGHAEEVWQSDDGENWEEYFYWFELILEENDVLLDAPEYDQSLYVVDLNRWQSKDNWEDAEFLDSEWERRKQT